MTGGYWPTCTSAMGTLALPAVRSISAGSLTAARALGPEAPPSASVLGAGTWAAPP